MLMNWNIIISDIESGCDCNVLVIVGTSYAAVWDQFFSNSKCTIGHDGQL